MKFIKFKNLIDITELTPETEIFRYFSYEKIKRSFEEHGLWFANSRCFCDKKERHLPDNFFNGWNISSIKHYKTLDEIKSNNIKAYISCWSLSNDDYAFWKIYNKENDGCMIATTVGKVEEQLSDFITYKVDYSEYKTKNAMPTLQLEMNPIMIINGKEKYKIKPYSFEKEVRFVKYSIEDEQGYCNPINFKKLINYAILSPFASEESKKVIENLLKQYVENIEIRKSDIEEKIQ